MMSDRVYSIPSIKNNDFIHDFLYNLPTTYRTRFKYFNNYIASIPKDIGCEIINAYIVHQRIRWAFQRLFNFWLYRKIRRRLPIQVEDPITLEPISLEYKVELIDLNSRRIFIFDSRSITRYLHTQLLEISKHQTSEIKNPYTHRSFLFKDYCGLYAVLQKKTWAIELFYECGFSADIWKILSRRVCELKELRREIINKTDSFTGDFLSFIEIELERLQTPHREPIYAIVEFGIRHQLLCQHEFIQQLIEIYRLYNEAQITGRFIDGIILNLIRESFQNKRVREYLSYIRTKCNDSGLDAFQNIF